MQMSEQLRIVYLRRDSTEVIKSKRTEAQLDKDWETVKLCSRVLLQRWSNNE
jgi:hypothetical protein